MKMPGKCTGPKNVSENVGQWRNAHLGDHDLVRRVDRQGEVLIWCRKCSGHARQRIRRKLVNCSKPDQVSTKEHGNMLKRIQILEDDRVLAKEANNWKIDGQRRRITRKAYQRLWKNGRFFMLKRTMIFLKKHKPLRDRGALPREEGDAIREFEAMHEENIMGWLREDWKSKTKEDKEVREDEERKEKRGTEKEECKTVVKRKCVNPVSVEAWTFFQPRGNFGV